MHDFVEKMFDNSHKQYINVKGEKCWYSDKKDGISLDKLDVHELVRFILKESYTKYGSWIFKQVKGIPQGGNASPQIADLTLAWKEYKYLLKNGMEKIGIHLGSRYMDDLNILHDDNFESQKLKDIYGKNLEFNQTNLNSTTSNYLDLCLEVSQRGISTKLYNKTDDYNFKVIRITDYCSFTPANIKSSIIFGEILRIKRASSDITNFEERTKILERELQDVNYPKKLFNKMLTKVSQRYF